MISPKYLVKTTTKPRNPYENFEFRDLIRQGSIQKLQVSDSKQQLVPNKNRTLRDFQKILEV